MIKETDEVLKKDGLKYDNNDQILESKPRAVPPPKSIETQRAAERMVNRVLQTYSQSSQNSTQPGLIYNEKEKNLYFCWKLYCTQQNMNEKQIESAVITECERIRKPLPNCSLWDEIEKLNKDQQQNYDKADDIQISFIDQCRKLQTQWILNIDNFLHSDDNIQSLIDWIIKSVSDKPFIKSESSNIDGCDSLINSLFSWYLHSTCEKWCLCQRFSYERTKILDLILNIYQEVNNLSNASNSEQTPTSDQQQWKIRKQLIFPYISWIVKTSYIESSARRNEREIIANKLIELMQTNVFNDEEEQELLQNMNLDDFYQCLNQSDELNNSDSIKQNEIIKENINNSSSKQMKKNKKTKKQQHINHQYKQQQQYSSSETSDKYPESPPLFTSPQIHSIPIGCQSRIISPIIKSVHQQSPNIHSADYTHLSPQIQQQQQQLIVSPYISYNRPISPTLKYQSQIIPQQLNIAQNSTQTAYSNPLQYTQYQHQNNNINNNINNNNFIRCQQNSNFPFISVSNAHQQPFHSLSPILHYSLSPCIGLVSPIQTNQMNCYQHSITLPLQTSSNTKIPLQLTQQQNQSLSILQQARIAGNNKTNGYSSVNKEQVNSTQDLDLFCDDLIEQGQIHTNKTKRARESDNSNKQQQQQLHPALKRLRTE